MQEQLAKAEQERQAEWNRRNSRFERRTIDSGYYSVDPDTNVAAGRYRINRNGTGLRGRTLQS
ncbi:MAG TPA: hypothetical protein VEV84_07155 [Pyrinomonadaceae bacterium]|nr:hypothetical protein [Pyrinomonadaceae bacterium]